MFRFLQRSLHPQTVVSSKRAKRLRALQLDKLEERRLLAVADSIAIPSQTFFATTPEPIMAIGEVIPDGDVTFRWSVYRDRLDSGTVGGWDQDDELVYLEANFSTPVLEQEVLDSLFYYPSSEDHVAGSFRYAPPYPTEPGVAPFGTGQYFIRLEVEDSDGPSDLTRESSLIEVQSGEETTVEAVLTPDANNTYVRGSEISFDASYVGDVTSPNYSWIVLKDGVFFDDGTGADVSFVPTSDGNYSIELTLNDGASVVDTLTFTDILVANSRVLGGVLSVGAASGGSNVSITAAAGGVNVTLDGVTTTYTGLAGINLYGQAGNDLVTVTGNISTPLVIDAGAGNDTILIGSAVTSKVIALGGDGNDVIVGGSGNNVLVGGNGVDILTGGGARDILIGGDGSDILIGNSQDDILIAGSTDHDNSVAALNLIMAQWTSPASFINRVNGLKASYLNNSTVHDDGDIDILFGLGGTDWFLINRTGSGVKDIALDANGNEINNRLEQ